jgi:hypothetical protein
MHRLAMLYTTLGRHAEAEPLLVKAVEGRGNMLGETHPDTLDSMGNLVKLYEAWGKPEQAEQWRAKLPHEQGTEQR